MNLNEFKHLKTQTYHKYLKIFPILQKESSRVIRELCTSVKNALNEVAPNTIQQANEDYTVQPKSTEQNEDDQEQVDTDADDYNF